MLLQTGIVAPLMLMLIVYTAMREERSSVSRSLVWLLSMILVWMVGMVVVVRDASSMIAQAMAIVPACFMSPLFLLVMLRFTRVEFFEQRRGATYALMAPYFVFLAAFATQKHHGLMVDPDAFMTTGGVDEAGPLFWAFQVWSNAAAVVGLGICLRTVWASPSPSERRRMILLCAGVVVPLAAHVAWMLHWLPTEYPLTPASLGVTSLLIVAAIRRYKLLDVQPIARRDVLEASGDGVIVADSDELVVDLNPAAAAMLAGSRSEICGSQLDDAIALLGPTEPEGALHGLLAELGQGQVPPRIEVETADGRVLEVSVGVADDGSGTRAGSFVVLRDRTSERRSERLLHQRQKLESVGILAAGIAHEVNNPLAFVRANIEHLRHAAELIEDELDNLPKDVADELRDLSEVVEDSIDGLDRIQRIVQGMVRFSRMPTGRRIDCDANDAVIEAARFASLDRGSPVKLETHLDQALPRLVASPDQLVQVILNLLLNSRRALRDVADARIVTSTRCNDGWIEIRVADNGPGVPEAIRDKVFDPFFTTGAPGEGTGLGLAIAFDIIRDHDGMIELASPPEGGACFVVRLPVGPLSAG